MSGPAAGAVPGVEPGDVRIERVQVAELPAFAERAAEQAARTGGILPISPERALSQSRNPHASGDEVGLITAWQGERCVGYLGVVPGRLELEGERLPMAWLSSWLVSAELRGQRVGARMLDEAKQLGRDLFATMYNRASARVLEAGGFQQIGALPFWEVDLRRGAPWAELTRALRRGLRRSTGAAGRIAVALDRAATAPVRRPLLALLLRRRRAALRGLRSEQLAHVGPDLLPEPQPGGPRFVRDAATVQWVLRYPWVREGTEPAGGPSYHFSRTRRLFRYVPLHFRADQAEGFLLLSVSDAGERTLLRVLEHALSGRRAPESALALILRCAAEYGPDTLHLPDRLAPLIEADPLLRRLAERQERPYLAWFVEPEGRVARAASSLRLSYADCDVAFV